MIDAYLKKGARLPTQADLDGRRRVVEDVITSSLFSPVRFMPVGDVAQIIRWLAGRNLELPKDGCKIVLWQRYKSVLGCRNECSIEPDLTFEFFDDSGLIVRVIIEIKWDDILTEVQVRDQLLACGSGQTKLIHISIVKVAAPEVSDLKNVIVRMWHQVLRDLRDVSQHNRSSANAWREDAVAFLQKLGIGSFAGFSTGLTLELPLAGEGVFFTPPQWFGQIRSIEKLAGL
jgi:hypothetical protein